MKRYIVVYTCGQARTAAVLGILRFNNMATLFFLVAMQKRCTMLDTTTIEQWFYGTVCAWQKGRCATDECYNILAEGLSKRTNRKD